VLIKVEMVEWFDEVSPVEVRINTEHLAEDCLADVDKLWWEAAALANPITRTSKL
jgi:hypothetical protein